MLQELGFCKGRKARARQEPAPGATCIQKYSDSEVGKGVRFKWGQVEVGRCSAQELIPRLLWEELPRSPRKRRITQNALSNRSNSAKNSSTGIIEC